MNLLKQILVGNLLISASLLGEHFDKKHTFTLTHDPIDVVITARNKGRTEQCIDSIRKYGNRVRDIYVISPTQVTDKALWVDEKIFPFDIPTVAKNLFKDEKKAEAFIAKGRGRIGWYLQQLLKLYSPLVIPNISPNVLLMDADVIFLEPISFMNEQNEPFFCTASENHAPYFTHGAKLIDGFKRVTPFSGIAHHMLIQKDVILKLFNEVETKHKMPMWQAMCRCVSLRENGTLPSTGYSEYEIYFNYFMNSSNQGHLRPLKWKNVSKNDPVWNNVLDSTQLQRFIDEGCTFISRH